VLADGESCAGVVGNEAFFRVHDFERQGWGVFV
jgi:hypothetical protein